MSEEAFYWQHKQEYGIYPDEDGKPDPDMEGYDFRCPKCNEPSFDSEKGAEGLCVNCSADAANPEHEGVSNNQETGQDL